MDRPVAAAAGTGAEACIVLATYNGAEFLPEQLDTLLAQSHPHWRLFVRDDGSCDETRQLLASYAARDARIEILPPSAHNQGSLANFSRLLEHALATGAQHVFLMDQDDLWAPDKIARQLACMAQEEARRGAGTPILVHSDLELVDSNGTALHPSFMRFQHIHNEESSPLRTLLVQNFVTGCTVLANRALLELALPVPAEAAVHDWWLALTAAASGTIVCDPQPTVRYRQHGRNQIGAKGLGKGFRSAWRSLTGHAGAADFAQTVEQAKALARRLAERGRYVADNPQHQLLSEYCMLFEAPRPWHRRLRELRALGIRRQWLLRSWMLYLHAAIWSPGVGHR